MAGLIDELVSVLEEEIGFMRTLSEMADDKTEFIINNDVDSLKELTARENLTVSKFSRLEKKRIGLIKDIAEVLNENPYDITLKSLLRLVREQKEASALESCMNGLGRVINELKKKNDHNGELIQSSLDYVDFTMNLIRGAVSNKPTVLDSGGNQLGEYTSFLDIKN